MVFASDPAHTRLKLDLQLQIADLTWSRCMKHLEIVWRNSSPRPFERRCVPLQIAPDRRVYLVEELISRGDRRYWSKTAALEMVYGGRKAA